MRVRETLPDKVLELADEIELVDLPPDDLLARLREGKVYVRDQIGRAIQHFFGKGNLTALRELAMRVAAERVDAEMVNYMRAHAIAGPWPAQDRLLVCINESPVAKKLVRTAKRMAERARMPWIAVNVHTPRTDSLSDEAKDRIAEALRLAESLGGEASRCMPKSDVAKELLAFARSRNVTPHPARPTAAAAPVGLAARACRPGLLSLGGPFEITIVTPEDEPAADHLIQAGAPDLRPDLRAFGWATLAVAVAIAVAIVADRFLPLANLSLIFLMAVLFAAIRFGLWPSVYTSLLSFVAYNFFFTEPHHTFTVARREDVLTMIFFLVVAVIVGNLAARLKAQVEAMRLTARRTANLYDFSRKIAGAASLNDVLWAAVHHVASTLQCQSLVLLPREGGAARDRIRLSARGSDVADRLGRGALGLGARPGGRVGFGHAAGFGVAVPAAQDRTRAARPARRRVREPEAAADAGAAAPAGSAGRPGGGRDRAHQPRDRHRGSAPADRDGAAALGAALLGLPRPAHAAGLDHRLRHRPGERRRRAVQSDRAQLVQTILEESERLESLRPEPARHDPARLWRLAAEP